MDLFNTNAKKTEGTGMTGSRSENGVSSAAEVERLSEQMDQLEEALSKIYGQIGQKHYEECDFDAQDAEMLVLFREVEGQKAQIQEINDRIRALKGITTCKQCGADVRISDTFCGSCGARIITEIKVSPNGGVCSCCGHKVEPGQLFCSTCGAKVNVVEGDLEDDFDEDATIIYEPRTSDRKEELGEEIAPESGKRICPKCGRELQEDQVFCMFCGTKVEDAAEAAASSGARQAEGKAAPTVCPNCGAPLEPDDIFCINCGQKIAG